MALFRIPVLLPSICQLCGDGALASGDSDRSLCRDCEIDLPWIECGCRTCGLPLPDGGQQLQCGECLVTLTPFQCAITPFHYRKPLDTLITGFKYRERLIHGKLLGQLLAGSIRDYYGDADHDLPEVILPVPLHWQRFLWRGYNQSAELGHWLEQDLDIPCNDRVLKRVRLTPNQQSLRREDRLHNLDGAFALRKPITFKRVALLDDVVTTGSTVNEIGRLLLKAGVAEIHLWAIARTPA